MTDWLEFHDSILMEFHARGPHVELLLDAYIHRWERREDQWRGTGWMQGVRIVLSNAVGTLVLPMPSVEISDGWLRLGALARNSVVRLPLQTSGGCTIRLVLTTGDPVEITGSAVHIEATGDARYVEQLPAHLRPQDPEPAD